MAKKIRLVTLTAFFFTLGLVQADESNNDINSSANITTPPAAIFKPFTGKITRNNVRLRLQPTLDSFILKELNRHDRVIVVGENDEFYKVQPSSDFKGYVFRTFVLDGVIEGNRVNIRLEPSIDAPIIGQLNTGDRVEGRISPLNSKWLEISPPSSTPFYICKEYVENIGDPSVMAALVKRTEEVENLLLEAREQAGFEMQKPYEQIPIQKLVDNFNYIINNYYDFPDSISQAKEHLEVIQETYLQKKIAYLEHKTTDLNNKLALHEKSFSEVAQVSSSSMPIIIDSETLGKKISSWIPIEQVLYQKWSQNHPGSTIESFYAEQRKQSIVLKGIIEPYSRSIRNKPGDFILISKANQLPTAYLYSTFVDLESVIGKEVSLRVIPRPNHNFAFPAYFVISFE